ncbi:methanol dehydrogenase transcriptional regulatory MoxR2 domain protein [Mycobacterium xenopi 4042]|uniref:Methanol dehydrogenase transcriptional regulatory MoxR2 domain protein n=1 Tax=Mycobacterium xenopi 4042 TaxID=1299334 RepID=X8EWP5_MYCXE|nr:methanol dehydrogenase transcriptional regulatory MoxR2 domain protein [Mycobacterium xenopi 4042]
MFRLAAPPRCWALPGVVMAVGPQLRHPRRREGDGPPTLRHRVSLRPEAELEGATPDGVLDGILASVPVPR